MPANIISLFDSPEQYSAISRDGAGSNGLGVGDGEVDGKAELVGFIDEVGLNDGRGLEVGANVDSSSSLPCPSSELTLSVKEAWNESVLSEEVSFNMSTICTSDVDVVDDDCGVNDELELVINSCSSEYTQNLLYSLHCSVFFSWQLVTTCSPYKLVCTPLVEMDEPVIDTGA